MRRYAAMCGRWERCWGRCCGSSRGMRCLARWRACGGRRLRGARRMGRRMLRRRRSHLQQAQALTHEVAADARTAFFLARAFAFYFELINLAETNHRKRRRRSSLLEAAAEPQRGSLRGTLRRLRDAGFSREITLALLEQICITPVFTAHPTEVARRSVMFKRQEHFGPAGEAGWDSVAGDGARRAGGGAAGGDYSAVADR